MLFWDHRLDRVRGRTLGQGVPEFGLEAGDRLEPSPHLPAVGEFSAIQTPFVAAFWRSHFSGQAVTDAVNHRNPLFSDSIYVWPSMTFVLDVLHVLYLGIHGRIVSAIIWAIIRANPWSIHGPFDLVCAVGLSRLHGDLEHWYDANNVSQDYRVKRFEKSMIGAEEYPIMQTMGSETNRMLPWAEKVCGEFVGAMHNGRHLLDAVSSLRKHMEILKAAPKQPPPATVQQLFDLAKQHNLSIQLAGFTHLHKNHFWVHMVRRITRFGNPMYYGTFLDESLNLDAAVATASSHAANWEVRTFEKLSLHGQLARGHARHFFGTSAAS